MIRNSHINNKRAFRDALNDMADEKLDISMFDDLKKFRGSSSKDEKSIKSNTQAGIKN